jgi:dihydrofolate synthase/folylpolyglutamate synthase
LVGFDLKLPDCLPAGIDRGALDIFAGKTMPSSLTLSAWLTLLETRHPLSIDMGLDRVSEVWKRMGKPQPASRVITVAGTNGKGSTTMYITAALSALGFRCASYTSPHLFQYNERVQVLGAMASDEDLVNAFEQIESIRGEISLSYFEFGTLAAFAVMARSGLDFAVLEVGLGGRLDAVNVLSADCAVITDWSGSSGVPGQGPGSYRR